GAATCCCQAANYLEECLNHYDYNNIKQMLEKMHRLEHDADTKKHEMTAALAKAFVTPLDREDLAVISQNIDEVADCIEEVLQRFYVDQIKTVTPEALEFAKRIVKCCDLMKNMLTELANFKKPQKLHEMIIELSHMEETCDDLYLEATLKVRDHCSDVLDIISWREIYDHMEDCADACEHVGDSIELIVMKNT
ncbi:MAG: DUF47 domain-containing protein, partial [Lachnospiraceae bacterium]|nr:DUF47 domain-containing protein [Lachnospiraceae bacterium]